MFHFKQFQIDQTGCAMKINTDGVLLGALAGHGAPKTMLDIGTGTGVIAIMMAQRFPDAVVDAVEIDKDAAETAGKNFQNFDFSQRVHIYPMGFEVYFQTHPERKYDLIITNPPFYINSLEATGAKKNLAKHADGFFFETLIKTIAAQLTANGTCWLVLPIPTVTLVKQLALLSGLFVQQIINLHSFADSNAHREIISFGLSETKLIAHKFIIYEAPKVYSEQYRECLKDFFTIF